MLRILYLPKGDPSVTHAVGYRGLVAALREFFRLGPQTYLQSWCSQARSSYPPRVTFIAPALRDILATWPRGVGFALSPRIRTFSHFLFHLARQIFRCPSRHGSGSFVCDPGFSPRILLCTFSLPIRFSPRPTFCVDMEFVLSPAQRCRVFRKLFSLRPRLSLGQFFVDNLNIPAFPRVPK